jgi:hypothetical protein
MVYKLGGQERQHLTAPKKNWRLGASYDSFVVNQTLVVSLIINLKA